MHNNIDSDTNGENNSNSCNNRKKRITRIKSIIIVITIILLTLPTICCIILGLRVSKLQKQVKDLSNIHKQYEIIGGSLEGESYAFAAERKEVPEASDLDKNDMISESQEQTVPDLLDRNASEYEEVPEGKESKEEGSEKDRTDVPSSKKTGKYAEKKVYLTFDDGPSKHTDDILDILAEYEAKATFFVIGKTDDESKRLYQRIVEEGHTLGMHSYSHQYSKIYNSLEDFDKDFTKLWKLLYDTTGYKPSIYRFPGGSRNQVNKNGMEDFIRYLNDAGIVYFDWNVLNGDATGEKFTKEELIKNVIDGIDVKKNSIVLMHDSETKQTTVDSLPDLLEILISEDAQILPLDRNVPPIQMIKADKIK